MSEFYETKVRVRYVETDQMGVVYHANFYREMEQKDDSFIVVVETHCRHLRPARYDDVIKIRTRVSEAGSRTVSFEYEVLNDATGELLATGETKHVVCDRQGRPKQISNDYRAAFGVALSPQTSSGS